MILLKMEDSIVLISLSTGKYNWVYSYNQYVKATMRQRYRLKSDSMIYNQYV